MLPQGIRELLLYLLFTACVSIPTAAPPVTCAAAAAAPMIICRTELARTAGLAEYGLDPGVLPLVNFEGGFLLQRPSDDHRCNRLSARCPPIGVKSTPSAAPARPLGSPSLRRSLLFSSLLLRCGVLGRGLNSTLNDVWKNDDNNCFVLLVEEYMQLPGGQAGRQAGSCRRWAMCALPRGCPPACLRV